MKIYHVLVYMYTLIHFAMDSLLLSSLSLTLLPQSDGDINSCNTVTAVRCCCYCNKQRHRVLSHWSRMISNKGSGRVIVTRCSLSHTHTRTVVDRSERERVSEQGLIPAAGTCACVCVSKHLGRLPLHRPTGTSGSDSNNGSNAGGGEMEGGQSGMRGWYLRLCPPLSETPTTSATAADRISVPHPHIILYSSIL